jgi:hypothetical protein
MTNEATEQSVLRRSGRRDEVARQSRGQTNIEVATLDAAIEAGSAGPALLVAVTT